MWEQKNIEQTTSWYYEISGWIVVNVLYVNSIHPSWLTESKITPSFHTLPVMQPEGVMLISSLGESAIGSARWFGIPEIPLRNNPCHKGILGIQTTNSNHQWAISWVNES